ncbi:hypothetical protein DFH09DRAFT_1112551 [Mycena vulgaris]|nr:hypothetical protein DFH09DRAFT_1112551 [Mycena vulgaris]
MHLRLSSHSRLRQYHVNCTAAYAPAEEAVRGLCASCGGTDRWESPEVGRSWRIDVGGRRQAVNPAEARRQNSTARQPRSAGCADGPPERSELPPTCTNIRILMIRSKSDQWRCRLQWSLLRKLPDSSTFKYKSGRAYHYLCERILRTRGDPHAPHYATVRRKELGIRDPGPFMLGIIVNVKSIAVNTAAPSQTSYTTSSGGGLADNPTRQISRLSGTARRELTFLACARAEWLVSGVGVDFGGIIKRAGAWLATKIS